MPLRWLHLNTDHAPSISRAVTAEPAARLSLMATCTHEVASVARAARPGTARPGNSCWPMQRTSILLAFKEHLHKNTRQFTSRKGCWLITITIITNDFVFNFRRMLLFLTLLDLFLFEDCMGGRCVVAFDVCVSNVS